MPLDSFYIPPENIKPEVFRGYKKTNVMKQVNALCLHNGQTHFKIIATFTINFQVYVVLIFRTFCTFSYQQNRSYENVV